MPKAMGDIYYSNHHSTGVSSAFVFVCVCASVFACTCVCECMCRHVCVHLEWSQCQVSSWALSSSWGRLSHWTHSSQIWSNLASLPGVSVSLLEFWHSRQLPLLPAIYVSSGSLTLIPTSVEQMVYPLSHFHSSTEESFEEAPDCWMFNNLPEC